MDFLQSALHVSHCSAVEAFKRRSVCEHTLSASGGLSQSYIWGDKSNKNPETQRALSHKGWRKRTWTYGQELQLCCNSLIGWRTLETPQSFINLKPRWFCSKIFRPWLETDNLKTLKKQKAICHVRCTWFCSFRIKVYRNTSIGVVAWAAEWCDMMGSSTPQWRSPLMTLVWID